MKIATQPHTKIYDLVSRVDFKRILINKKSEPRHILGVRLR